MTTFFTSDTHFRHGRIRDYCPLRGSEFRDVDHMDTELVRRWNEIVKPDDVVTCLGDMVMGRREESLPILARLNGRKRLIVGNHDYCAPWLWKPGQAAKAQKWLEMYAPYFESIDLTGGHILPDGTWVRLNHFPYVGDSHEEDRYQDQRPIDDGTPLLHGHVHDMWKVAYTEDGTPMVNVGVDVWGFRPITEEQIMEAMNS